MSVQLHRMISAYLLLPVFQVCLSGKINILLCWGEVVTYMFDARMNLGGGMFLKDISQYVDVGFLVLL